MQRGGHQQVDVAPPRYGLDRRVMLGDGSGLYGPIGESTAHGHVVAAAGEQGAAVGGPVNA
jgi:hypothetical protein